MADQGSDEKNHGRRPRISTIPAPPWVRALARTAAETVLDELAQIGAKQQQQREQRFDGGAQGPPEVEDEAPDGASTGGRSQGHEREPDQGKGAHPLRDRLLQLLLNSEALRAVDPAVVTRWVEEQGADTWLLLMAKWERLSREVVDEQLQVSGSERTKRTRGYFDKMERWESAANFVIGKVIDFNLDTPEAKRARRHNRPSNDEN